MNEVTYLTKDSIGAGPSAKWVYMKVKLGLYAKLCVALVFISVLLGCDAI